MTNICVYFGTDDDQLKFGNKYEYGLSDGNYFVFIPGYAFKIIYKDEFSEKFKTIQQIRDWKIKQILDE